jgi:DNA-directed RNA polymerase subunit RPC12/RpoP
MKRIRSGTLAGKATVVLKQAEGGMRRIRCPKCQMLAMPVTHANGTKVYKCGGCGTEYTSHAF